VLQLYFIQNVLLQSMLHFWVITTFTVFTKRQIHEMQSCVALIKTSVSNCITISQLYELINLYNWLQ